ncbi:MAG: hypothetical protein IJV22_04180 [Bacteroidales bacterium]|nr:hypothetical protein [Bacteroidales bacterium]
MEIDAAQRRNRRLTACPSAARACMLAAGRLCVWGWSATDARLTGGALAKKRYLCTCGWRRHQMRQ